MSWALDLALTAVSRSATIFATPSAHLAKDASDKSLERGAFETANVPAGAELALAGPSVLCTAGMGFCLGFRVVTDFAGAAFSAETALAGDDVTFAE